MGMGKVGAGGWGVFTGWFLLQMIKSSKRTAVMAVQALSDVPTMANFLL